MSENTENMVAVGLDPSGVRGDLKEIQNYLNRNPVKLSYTLDKSSLKKTVDQLSAQISKNLKIEKISVDTNKIKASLNTSLNKSNVFKDTANNIIGSISSKLNTGITDSIINLIKSSGRNKTHYPLYMPLGSLAVMCTSYIS
ncbi:hypothetical protein [Diplocloster modestus]|uniref:Uncharacterized protein n=1 Tax=Diplocloster modestus TaxID=2850322 RepID=A0ABS6KEI5_9FIRM|nr:hypothetical protein [Diplocloster modestus]MBU9728945.1 hypothetical protein [Diplocloster modestus]